MTTSLHDLITVGTGLLILRLVFGLMMAAHGSQKLFGWFEGHGLHTTGEFFAQLGFPPGKTFALAAGLSEFVGGLLIALGFLGAIGPAIVIAVMIVAILTVHLPNGLFAANNGIEVPLLYATAAVAVALVGPGLYSVDAAFGLGRIWTPSHDVLVLGIGVFGGLANALLARRRAQGVTA